MKLGEGSDIMKEKKNTLRGEIMKESRFNMTLIRHLKDILLSLKDEKSIEDFKEEFHLLVKDVPPEEILLILYEIKSDDYGITDGQIEQLFMLYEQLFEQSIDLIDIPNLNHPAHPIQIFKAENEAIESTLKEMKDVMAMVDAEVRLLEKPEIIVKLNKTMRKLGQVFNHYHRKEKIMFSILERYGHFTMTRIMWGEDDRIRNFYKGAKSMFERLPNLPFQYVKKTYDLFARKCRDMINYEETYLLPVLAVFFTEEDWLAVAEESEAFGYTLIDEEDIQQFSKKRESESSEENHENQLFRFGGGYLMVKEANNILNNLPLEITFVDKYGVFKYFNNIVKSSEMMFIRTSSSIGRNVMNCHPPSSAKKVMSLINDLHKKRRPYETMWFKKDGRFVYITYKALFTDDGEYLGILEYVQDIQPFFELPSEVKKELSKLQ